MVRTLQGAAQELLHDLEAASVLYHKSPDDRRQGVIDSVLSVVRFLDKAARRHGDLEAEDPIDRMKDAFFALSTALSELRNGTVDDLLRPASFGNAAPISNNVRLKRAVAAAAMEILIDGAGFGRMEAAKFVAKRIEGSGLFKQLKNPAKAVEDWRDQIRAAKERPLLESVDLSKHDRLDVAYFYHLIGEGVRRREAGEWVQDHQRMFAESILGIGDMSAGFW